MWLSPVILKNTKSGSADQNSCMKLNIWQTYFSKTLYICVCEYMHAFVSAWSCLASNKMVSINSTVMPTHFSIKKTFDWCDLFLIKSWIKIIYLTSLWRILQTVIPPPWDSERKKKSYFQINLEKVADEIFYFKLQLQLTKMFSAFFGNRGKWYSSSFILEIKWQQ